MSRKAPRSVPPTSRDVAARAGVSPMTVSRALRRPELVSEAESLGYRSGDSE